MYLGTLRVVVLPIHLLPYFLQVFCLPQLLAHPIVFECHKLARSFPGVLHCLFRGIGLPRLVGYYRDLLLLQIGLLQCLEHLRRINIEVWLPRFRFHIHLHQVVLQRFLLSCLGEPYDHGVGDMPDHSSSVQSDRRRDRLLEIYRGEHWVF